MLEFSGGDTDRNQSCGYQCNVLGKHFDQMTDGGAFYHSGVDREFNLLTVAPEETGAMFIDRYNAKVAAISAIDLLQLSSKITRLNALKTAIKSAFPILFALMIMKEAEV